MSSVFIEINSGNLDNLPESPAVYAFWAKSEKSQPINCRYVGQTDNLRRRIKEHFSNSSHNECLKEFIDSGKAIILEYMEMVDSTEHRRLNTEKEWIFLRSPKCNE